MVYIDPPYGIRYGSNFQPFVRQREVSDGKDEDLTAEPEQIRAFRDTWELGIHSYLAYLRDRLLLARELLHESGSCFVQIGDENVHRVGVVLDDIFGAENRMATISFATTSGSSATHLPQVADYLLWYAVDKAKVKYRQLYEPLTRTEIVDYFSWHAGVELSDGSCRKPTPQERFDPGLYLPEGARIYQPLRARLARRIHSPGAPSRMDGTAGSFAAVGTGNGLFRGMAWIDWRSWGRLEALEGQDLAKVEEIRG